VKIRFIFNPRSGPRRRNAHVLPLLREFIASRRLDAELEVTTSPGHATDLARAAVADRCDRVVSVGGDGTMNEVAQALVHSPTALALVPCGSGNGLARHLGLPISHLPALELAADPAARIATIDTGTVNQRPFFNAMGLGFDAEISRRFAQVTGRGLAGYVRAVLGAFGGWKGELCHIEAGSEREAIEILLIAIANSDEYGSGAIIAPGARVDDGLLDLVAVRPLGLFRAMAFAVRLFRGTLDHSGSIRHLRGARFVVERPAPGLIHTDGECHSEGAILEIAVQPGSLKMVTPAQGANVPA
jgi:diacylglycerol kinase (ATP)